MAGTVRLRAVRPLRRRATNLAAALATALLATPVGPLISQIVRVTDPVAYVASLGVIVAACLSAAWIPAARAAKVEPIRALRQE